MKTLLAIFTSFLYCSAVAQNSLRGKVTDFQDHSPVVGVTVYIPDLKKGASTNTDGIRQEGQQWGDEHGIEIDEYSVDRVEIIKGAGSLMYGSDGLGGVLNFLTSNPVAEGTVIGKWLSNYQTNNGLIGNSLLNAGNLKGLYWLARASFKDAKPYSNAYDGKVFNSGFRERDVNGHIGLSKPWGYSQLNVSSFHQVL